MESKALVAVSSELRKQHNQLREKASLLRAELGAMEEEATRIDAALAALSGNSPKSAANGARARTAKKASQTPSAKKADVIAAMKRVLENERVMDADELKKRVEAVLTEAGFNRFGFAMRWNEACCDSQFIHTADGMTLHSESDATAMNTFHASSNNFNSLQSPRERRNVQ